MNECRLILKKLLYPALYFFIFFITCFTGSAQYLKYTANQEIDYIIQQFLNKLGIVGLNIAVVNNDSIIFNKAYGYKDVEKQSKYSVDDICWIGSVSKTFVATGIMQLVEKGFLELDDDANKYLNFNLRNPKFPHTPITIRMLLTHKSSIMDYGPWYSFKFLNPEENTEYYKYYLSFSPGTGYKYCNYNYNILAAIIENVSNIRFDVYIENNITKPLDIYGSYNCNLLDSNKFVTIYHEENGEMKNSHVPYKNYEKYLLNSYKPNENLGLLYPAAGMKISAYNLAKYMKMHMDGGMGNSHRIISEESEFIMRTIEPGTENYGLSFRVYKGIIEGVTMYGQTGGGTLGEKTAMIFNPVEKYGFVIITNGSKSKYIDGYEDIHKPLIKILYDYLIIHEKTATL